MAWKMEPRMDKQSKRARNCILDARKTQQTMD